MGEPPAPPAEAGDAPPSPPEGGIAADRGLGVLDIAADFTTKATKASSPFIECLMSYIRQKIN